MTTATRQMSLVGFMQAGNTSVYAGSWRHPATEHGFLTAGYYQKMARTLEEGCFDLMFFDDRLAMPGIYGGSVAEAVRAGRPSGEARPEHRARRRGRRHPVDRARRDLLDDLLLAVPRRPHLRHPRPPLRRSGGVERRDVGERQRGPELRVRPAPRPRRALRPRRRVPRGDDARCGTRGRTTRSSSTASSGVFADPDKVHELNYDGQWFQVRGPLTRAAARRRVGPCCSRPDRRDGGATSPPAGRSSSSPATPASTSPGRTTRTRRNASPSAAVIPNR